MKRKLTKTDCVNICDDYLLGLSYNLLSEKYNICTWSIGNVLKKTILKVESVNIIVMNYYLGF